MSKLYYLAHPVGPNEHATYEQNIRRGIEWWAVLLRIGLKVCAPWVGLCKALDDRRASDRALGVEVDLLVMERCDGIIACGSLMSPGMQREWDRMGELGKEQHDFTGVFVVDVVTAVKRDLLDTPDGD